MTRFNRAFKLWVPIATVGAVLVLLVYVIAQQQYRQGANDPQIQIAEDTAVLLNNGATPQSVVPAQSVDIAKSLATFIIVTDDAGKVLASSATLNGTSPVPPQGVLTFAKDHGADTKWNGENRVTWAPQTSTRLATVVKRYSGSTSGYVIVGRNMREVEHRVSDLGTFSLIGVLGILIASFLIALLTV
jgi:hypothetical protein